MYFNDKAKSIFYILLTISIVEVLTLAFIYVQYEQEKAKVEERDKKIQMQSDIITQKEEEISTLQLKIVEYTKVINLLEEQGEELLEQKKQSETTITELKTEVEELNTANKNKDSKIKNLSEQLKNLEIELSTIQAAEKTNTVATLPSRRDPTSEKKSFYVEATAYTAYCNGCSGITATGINLRENPEVKVIAVDPSVIPLGSKVWVEGYGYAIAGDTGGAIKGNKIDVFIPEKAQAFQWGRKTVQIKILE